MKLTPAVVVSTTTSPSDHSNAKRTSACTVRYKMRGSIIKGRLYTIKPGYHHTTAK